MHTCRRRQGVQRKKFSVAYTHTHTHDDDQCQMSRPLYAVQTIDFLSLKQKQKKNEYHSNCITITFIK